MIWVQNQLISAYEGQQITLECYTEAYPNSISYWTRDGGRIVAQGRFSSMQQKIRTLLYRKLHEEAECVSYNHHESSVIKCLCVIPFALRALKA